MKTTLKGAWCLITGASSGLGEELARQLAHRGANLLLSARTEERLVRLADDLARVNGIGARALPEDLSDPAGPARLLRAVEATGVFVAHLINNAGVGTTGRFAELDPARESAMLRLNTLAPVELARGLIGPMLNERRGGILNVASTAAFQPLPFMASYGASKAFVLSFSEALAVELAGSGVQVMALCPGPVRTGFQAAAGFSKPGLPIAELSAQRTIEGALHAYERGERVYTPGVVNGAQAVAARLMPKRLISWATTRTMKRLGRAS